MKGERKGGGWYRRCRRKLCLWWTAVAAFRCLSLFGYRWLLILSLHRHMSLRSGDVQPVRFKSSRRRRQPTSSLWSVGRCPALSQRFGRVLPSSHDYVYCATVVCRFFLSCLPGSGRPKTIAKTIGRCCQRMLIRCRLQRGRRLYGFARHCSLVRSLWTSRCYCVRASSSGHRLLPLMLWTSARNDCCCWCCFGCCCCCIGTFKPDAICKRRMRRAHLDLRIRLLALVAKP